MIEPSEILTIEVIEGGLRLSGEIDASCIDLLASHLNPLPSTSTGTSSDVILHLANVGFIDSSGLRELIDAHQRAERSGRRVLMMSPSPIVVRLFEISGLTKYLHVT